MEPNRIRLVGAEEWRSAAKSGETDGLGLLKDCAHEVVAVDEREAKEAGAGNASRVLRFTISTADVDRHGDTVSVAGWKLKAYRKNPVVLWAHDYFGPPIARALNVTRGDAALTSLAEFQDADLNPFADTVFRMLQGKWLRATSVGFVPLEWKWNDDEDRAGFDFKSQDLLEYSVVPVPANPAALMEAHKAGINTGPIKAWAERVLDLGEPLRGLTRDEIEKAWDAVASRPVIVDLKGTVTNEPEKQVEPPVPAPEVAATPKGTTDLECAVCGDRRTVSRDVAEALYCPNHCDSGELDVLNATCPECDGALANFALPIDGKALSLACAACGAGWTIQASEVVLLDDEPTFELDEGETFDVDLDTIEQQIERAVAGWKLGEAT